MRDEIRLPADQPPLAPAQRQLLISNRQITDAYQRPILHPAALRPAIGTDSLCCNGFNDNLDHPVGDTHSAHDKKDSSPNNKEVGSCMLVASLLSV